ncbi:MAG: nucleotidyltransferase domain-containing protein, partial [candidate division Zixibacteria bacterium]|nr:nucleotidyltransferase domain-containing protein [candidate division Zixibacteria bacterium]
CPIYEEIRSLIVKTAGVADVIRAALTNLTNRIDLAFLYGSIARGQETKNSDADILVIGDITFGELVEALNPAQDQIGREINPTVYPLPEFRSGLKSGNHFLTTVLNGKKIFLYGEPNELTKLVE